MENPKAFNITPV